MSSGAIIGCILVGGLFIYNYFKTGQENRKIQGWPRVNGEIKKTEFFPGGNRSGPKLVVVYEFVVNQTHYQSDMVYTNHREFGLSNREQIPQLDFIKNPVVRYDPANPEKSCLLLYPTNWVVTFLLVFGILLVMIGFGGVLFRFLE